ncbi:hypothetical protein LZC95_29085 [Pendulispora brunnea]|uniref:Lipoprotein n=1 Tax=Pendulispora brunnea TaxID=2905690 RepID=A0ABZ2JXK3_9BACT
MKRHLVLAFGVLSSLIAFPACSSDDDEKPAVVEELRMNCSAETVAGPAIDYTVSGNTLTISANGQSSQITRSGSASGDKPIYGTWQLPPATATSGDPAYAAKHQLRVTGNIRIEPNRVTVTTNCTTLEHVMSASATSPATITDTTLQVLEAHKEEKYWSSRTGESTLTKKSIDTLAVEPQLEGDEPLSGGVAFPFAAY